MTDCGSQMINRTLLQKQLQRPLRSLRRRVPPRIASSDHIAPRSPLQSSSVNCETAPKPRAAILGGALHPVLPALADINEAGGSNSSPPYCNHQQIQANLPEASRFGRVSLDWEHCGGGGSARGAAATLLSAHGGRALPDMSGPSLLQGTSARSLRQSMDESHPLEGACGAVEPGLWWGGVGG